MCFCESKNIEMYKRYLEPSSTSQSGNLTKYILKKLKIGEANSSPEIDTNDLCEDSNRSEKFEVDEDESTDFNYELNNGEGGFDADDADYEGEQNDAGDDEINDEREEYYDAELNAEADGDDTAEDEVENGEECNDEVSDSEEEHENRSMDGDDFFNTINDDLIHPNLKCKIADAVLMILSFFLRHRLTWVALQDMLTLFHAIIGDESRLPKTKYLLKKIFGVNKNADAVFHFYCKNCQLYIDTYQNLKIKIEENKGRDVACSNCNCLFSLHKMNDGHFFIYLPIRKQIENRITKNINILNYNTQADPDCIRDIFDGELYKRLRKEVGDGKLITLTMNTDGVRVFKSKRKSSLWPIQMFINEVPPNQRFKLQNIMLCGIWYGKDPDFHLYMKPFTDELEQFNQDKIKIKIDNVSTDINVRSLFMTTDSVGRCKVMSMKQFNGKFGCTNCLHPGEVLDKSSSNNHKYPITPKYKYDSRTHTSTASLMKDFYITGETICGILGVSPLLAIRDFDLIRGNPTDYMHCVLEGVTRLVTDFWFDSTKHFEEFYITPRRTETVNRNIACIKPLKSFPKNQRPIEDIAYWKANELHKWLLFYAIPCLKDVLKDKYLKHFALLSESIFILLKTNISANELKYAAINLKKFVVNFESLYGKNNMVYNVHLLTHLVETVIDCGPLWAYSNFNFESNNGVLIKHVNGTTDVEHQILSKYMYNNVLSDLKMKSEKASDYIDQIKDTRIRNSKKVGEITLLGKSRKQDLSSEEQLMLQQKRIWAYSKFFYKNDIFYSTSYKRAQQTNDTVVCLKDGSFGQILVIYENEESVFLLLKKLIVEADQCAKHIKQISTQTTTYAMVRADEIYEKCLLISTSKETYVSLLPNRFESD